jgi:hypothetical protein
MYLKILGDSGTIILEDISREGDIDVKYFYLFKFRIIV